MLSKIRNTICQVYAESAGSPYFAGVIGKPLPTPLFYRFKLAGGYAQTKTGYRRVMVADMKQERIRAELDERIGTLLQKHATDDLPGRVVTFADRPLAIQIPNPKRPAPIGWRSDIPATLKNIPLGVAYDWTGQQPVFWNRDADAHAIIAGTTGSGKSILMHSILASLVSHVSPDDLEIVAIDMDRGLTIFENAPHLRNAVAYEPSSAMALLSALVNELEDRAVTGRQSPAICIAIDELTDLAIGDSVVQEWLSVLARRGRKYNMFLLVGTQKPLIGEIGQAKSQLSLRLVGRMRSGKEAETAAGTSVDADSLYHPGSFYAVTGADRSTLFRGLFVSDSDIRQACAGFHGGGSSALRVVDVQAETGRAVLKEEQVNRQALEDAETLRTALNGALEGSSMREKVLALGLNPAGSNWYAGKARVEKALEAMNE